MEDFHHNINSQDQSYDWTSFTTDDDNETSNFPIHGLEIAAFIFHPLPESISVPVPVSQILTSNITNITDDILEVANSTEGPNSFSNFIAYDITDVVTCIIVCLGLPLTFLAIYSLYSQVSRDHVAPIYVINLLVSDLLQFSCLVVTVTPHTDTRIYLAFSDIYVYSLLASVGFMVCVAMERYLVIVHPLWYHCRRTIKTSMVVCAVVWLLPVIHLLPLHIGDNFKATHIIYTVFFLLPLPLLMFFLVATVKALSASISLSTEEKRRVVGVLVLVLLIYTLLFLPAVVWFVADGRRDHLHKVTLIFLRSSPLADLVLYVFMRKGAVDKLLAAVCCCRLDSSDTSSSAV